MAGAQAQHSLGNRETPRIAAGIFPIGGASGQRMRRYFFGASPPGGGGGAGTTRKSREQQEEAGTAGRSREQCGCRNARNARQRRPPREPAGGGNLPDRRQAAGSGRHTAESRQRATGSGRRAAGGPRQKAGSGRAAIRRAGGSIALKGRFHVHTNSDYRAPELRHSNGPRQRESGNDPEPAPPRSGKKHAGKQVLSTEIPRIHRKRDIRRPLTNYH